MNNGIEYINYDSYKCMDCHKKITVKRGRCRKCANKNRNLNKKENCESCKSKIEIGKSFEGKCLKCYKLSLINERRR